ncbi:MAG: hypothetical protein ABIL58_25000 [Pseudomonadota bacterium]
MNDFPSEPVMTLQIPASAEYLRVVTGCVEQSALALGLEADDALSLTLAAEEIFVYLCGLGTAERSVRMTCAGGGYFVRTDFYFSAAHFSLHAFNITASVSPEDETSMQDLGLLIASRSVDHHGISLEADGKRYRLSLIKEKTYPPLARVPAAAARPMAQYAIRSADTEDLKQMAAGICAHAAIGRVPSVCRTPGKLVDMAAAGHLRAAVAADAAGHVGGGLFWHRFGRRAVECRGPFVFDPASGPGMGADLLEACLGDIARTPAVALICRFPTPQLPKSYFEPLGTLDAVTTEGRSVAVTVFFRQMQEDPGTAAWVHPELETYLRQVYARMVLPRDVHVVQDMGERRPPESVLFAAFDRVHRQVTLQPVVAGADARDNLEGHLRLLKKEAIPTVFFEMDLGRSWQADFTPALLRSGFTPRLVIPYAGKGDLLIFQWEGAGK